MPETQILSRIQTRVHRARACLAAIPVLFSVASATPQVPPSSASVPAKSEAPAASADASPLLEEQRRQIEQLRREYEARIEALEDRLKKVEEAKASAQEEDELDELLRLAEASGPQPVARPNVSPNALNPQISVIPDFTARFEDVSGDQSVMDAFPGLFEERNPFALREVEVELRAAVAPGADAVAILAVGEEETAFEEAFLILHNLPFELKAKVGRFKMGFGRANVIHNHDLPQVDRPVVHALLFGEEGTSVDGISLSRPLYAGEPGRLAPTWSEITVELTNAANEESPLFGDGEHQEVAVASRVKSFWQINDRDDLEVGASLLLTGDNKTSEHNASTAAGIDVTYRNNDEVPGSYRNWLVMAEVIGSTVETDQEDIDALGGYLTIQRQLDPQRYVGLRLDAAESPFIADANIWGIVPYYTWYLNEFLRLRLQYQYLNGSYRSDSATSQGLALQLTWVFGAHPPEPYWVNR